MAPWFHGTMDEAAYYDHALSAHRIGDRYKIGTAKDKPSLVAGNSPFNTEGPFTDPGAPKNNGLYAPNKVPKANFSCTDPDDVPGNSDIASCTATVDGNPIANGDPLPDSPGAHTFTVTAIDEGGNTYVHNHIYTVKGFADIYKTDNPLVYCRLGDSGQTMVDSSANAHNGEYKNDTDSAPVGVSADGNRAREFFGAGGYGYINGDRRTPLPVDDGGLGQAARRLRLQQHRLRRQLAARRLVQPELERRRQRHRRRRAADDRRRPRRHQRHLRLRPHARLPRHLRRLRPLLTHGLRHRLQQPALGDVLRQGRRRALRPHQQRSGRRARDASARGAARRRP